jgi:hypothetical protein
MNNKRKMKKKIPFTKASKTIKYFGINTKKKKSGYMTQVVEPLLSKHKALCSNPSTNNHQNKKLNFFFFL